ncbi:MAG: SGNH/GDSL hydrolase family protein [Gemmatimonadaceae bacterium]
MDQAALRIALWMASLMLAAGGAGLLVKRPPVRPRHLLLVATQVAVILIAMEVAARLIVPTQPVDMRSLQLSDTLGWITRPNFRNTYNNPGFAPSYFSTDEHGFRRYGGLDSASFRVLAIGDSYTQAVSTSTGAAYFDKLAIDFPEIEVFAIGVVGYGTLQEYLLLDRLADSIRPHVVLWQLSSNDIINNDRELEAGSFWNNPWARKPYWEKGRIVYRMPTTSVLVEHSILARTVAIALWNRRRADPSRTVESSLTPDDPRTGRSLRAMADAFALARRRLPEASIVAFLATHDAYVPNVSDRVGRLLAQRGIHFIPGIPDSIEASRTAGVRVDGAPYDQHWSPAGHAVVARVLGRELVARGLIPSGSTRLTSRTALYDRTAP